MFSFAPSDQQQNTPFFSDNQEKPSIFNSQFTQQQSAFQLFNSSNGQSSNNEYSFLPKDNAKQSKKSIIMELDQFDRKEIFQQLGTLHMMGDNQKQSKARGLVESRVRKFGETQEFEGNSQALFNESRFDKVKENDQNKNGHDRLNKQINLNRSNQFQGSKAAQKQKEGASMNSKPKLLQKFNLKKAHINAQSFKIGEPESQPQSINYQNSRDMSSQQNSRPSRNVRNWQQQLGNNRKLFENEQQVGNKIGPNIQKKPTGNIFLNTSKQREADKVKVLEQKSEKNLVTQQNNDLKQSGSKIIMPTFQAKPKLIIDLKSSRVLPAAQCQKHIKQKSSVNMEDKFNRSLNNKIEVPMLSVEKERNANNQKSLTKFADILRRSMARSEASQQKIYEEKKVTGLKGIQMQNFGIQLNKKTIKPQTKDEKNEKNQTNNEFLPKSDHIAFSSTIPKPQIRTKHQKQVTQQHQPEQQQQQIKTKTITLAVQKNNRIKQKPCLNLKLIKDQIKNEVFEHRDENNRQQVVSNQNTSKINVLEKRDGVFTAKLFKDSNIFNKELSFGNFNKNKKEEEEFKQLMPQQKQDKTPKIPKIQSKNTKTMNIRSTQKLNSSSVFQKDIPAQPTSPKQQKHRINYQFYENELQTLFSQMEQTKKKYLKSDQSYKDIFLLLNKANIIMNQRFISGTQTQTQKTTDDKNKEK